METFGWRTGASLARRACVSKRVFPALARTQAAIVLIEAKETSLTSVESEWCSWETSLIAEIEAEYPCSSGSSCFLRSVSSYCALVAEGAGPLASTMVEPSVENATRATLTVTYDEKASQEKRDRLNNWVKRRARTLRDDMGLEDAFRLSFTGVDALMADGIKGTKKDLSNVDTRSLPLALFVMACTLRNLPLIIIPIFCMLFATVVEFAIMAAVATQVSIVSFAPSVMMTLT